MNSRLRNAAIDDICVKDLIFYEEANRDNLYKFCFRNSISFLPAPDRKSVYKLTSDGFINRTLNFDYCLHPNEPLFAESTISKFAKVDENEIKFVVKDGLITGVVHIVDYNNEFVAVELYRAFFRFENNLRKLLMRNGFSNEDFISWVKLNRDWEMNESNTGSYWADKLATLCPADPLMFAKKENSRRSVYPFQTFYFSDLLQFALDYKVLPREPFNAKALRLLRNFVAHNRHFISIAESGDGQLLYDFNHLQLFKENMTVFFAAEDHLEQLLITTPVNISFADK